MVLKLSPVHSLGSRTTFLNTRRSSDTVAILYRQRRETRAYGWWWWGSSAPSASTPPASIPTPDSPLEAPPPTQSPPTIDPTSATTDSSTSIPLLSDSQLTGSSDIAASDILDVIANGDHIGDLASLGLARWTPTGLLQSLLEQVHVNVGLSWWATIIVCSIGIRLLVTPILLKAQVNNLRLNVIRPEMEKHFAQLKKAKEAGDMQTAQKASIRAQKLLKDHDCHPLKGLIAPVVQVPLAIAFFTAIRGMCKLPLESMTTGGGLWFIDLTTYDPYFILPVASSASILILIKASQQDNPQTPAMGHFNNFFKVLAVGATAFTAFLPSALLLYFIANGAFMGLQSLLFRIPSFRVWAGVPPLSHDIKTTGPTMRDSLDAYIKYVREKREKVVQEARQPSNFGTPVTTTLSAFEKGSQGSAGKKSSMTSGRAKAGDS